MGTKDTADTEQPGTTAKRQRPRSLKRYWWLGLIILLIALTGGCYLREVQPCLAFAPTGDALYDRYAQAVIREHGWRLFASWNEHDTNPTTLPDDLLASWEVDFGDDPRYWQLRYWCTLYRHRNPLVENSVTLDDLREARKQLETARERGVADAETLLLIYSTAQNDWYDLVAEEQDAYIEDEWGFTNVDPDKAVAVNSEVESRIMGLLDEAIEISNDECWPYWQRGMLNLSWGEEEAGLADLLAGNDCLNNTIPICFPASRVVSPHPQYPGNGNDVLAGAILDISLESSYLSTHYLVKVKEIAKEQTIRMALGGDVDLTDAINHMACRMATADRNNGFHQYFMAAIINVLASECLDQCSTTLTSDQISVLQDITQFNYKVQRLEETRATANALEDPALALVVKNYLPYGEMPGTLEHNIADFRDVNAEPELHGAAQWLDANLMKYPWRYYPRLTPFWQEHSGADLYSYEFWVVNDVDYHNLQRPESWEPYATFVQ